MSYINELGKRAKAAEMAIADASTEKKNKALEEIATALEENVALIIKENAVDLANAKENNMPAAMQDRLALDEGRIKGIADAVRELISLDDPIGSIDSGIVRPNGLRINKMRVPLGVIGIIYESRPNVTVDAATLCLKSGNVSILRGGKEAFNSNKCLMNIMREAVVKAGFPADTISLVEDTSRDVATDLMRASDYLDVLIPRGGTGLIKAVLKNATVPVIETGAGNCHIYIDESADHRMAVDIIDNAKTSRPSVCNAAETLLVHKGIAKAVLPDIKARLDKHNVEIRGCAKTREILGDNIICATDDDYAEEFHDYILAIKVVDDIEEAISHIRKYGTKHSEAIVTNDYNNSVKFQMQVDAAAVYVNASIRYTDGGEFGLGAEIGISTQKLHARGPMGLRELTTVKFLVNGEGQIR
ncbi:MAG: glutamate-5-semialdehyde dehydrogenase [Clostridiales bacterium]|nr:glutamate-5-semialdehyde dehydrogenase [Clostridiales bacterium]